MSVLILFYVFRKYWSVNALIFYPFDCLTIWFYFTIVYTTRISFFLLQLRKSAISWNERRRSGTDSERGASLQWYELKHWLDSETLYIAACIVKMESSLSPVSALVSGSIVTIICIPLFYSSFAVFRLSCHYLSQIHAKTKIRKKK